MNLFSRKLGALFLGLGLSFLGLVMVEGSSYLLLHSSWASFFQPVLSRGNGNDILRALAQNPMFVPTTEYSGPSKLITPSEIDSGDLEESRMVARDSLLFIDGSAIGFIPGSHYRSIVSSKKNGQPIYDVEVTIDPFGRRHSTPTSEGKRHAIFMGCSFVFGQGVRDDFTLPSSFSKVAPSYSGYNLGQPAQSASGVLARMRYTPWTKGIEQSRGFAVYVFLFDHINRATGNLSIAGERVWSLPAMEDHGGTDFHYRGSFRQSQPLRSFFLQMFGRTNFAHLFRLDWQPRWQEKDLDYFARLVAAVKKEYLEKFPGNEFYFAFYPGETVSALKLSPFLQKYNIRFLYYQPDILWNLSEGPAEIPGEGHPSEAAHAAFAKLLATDVEKDLKH